MTGHFDVSFGNWLPDDPKYYCDKCGEEFAEDDLTEIKGDMICEDCKDLYFIECELCGDHTEEDDIVETSDGKRVCQSCYDDNYPES